VVRARSWWLSPAGCITRLGTLVYLALRFGRNKLAPAEALSAVLLILLLAAIWRTTRESVSGGATAAVTS
jgi:hypothetical protein